jgi:hypothetical protein
MKAYDYPGVGTASYGIRREIQLPDGVGLGSELCLKKQVKYLIDNSIGKFHVQLSLEFGGIVAIVTVHSRQTEMPGILHFPRLLDRGECSLKFLLKAVPPPAPVKQVGFLDVEHPVLEIGLRAAENDGRCAMPAKQRESLVEELLTSVIKGDEIPLMPRMSGRT